MNKQHLFEDILKKIGLVGVDGNCVETINSDTYKQYIKVLYLPKGYKLTVDFAVYETEEPALFFVAPNQFLKIEQCGPEPGHMIFYNRDFYCIQIHDQEVACDGLLYNNIHNMPLVTISQGEAHFIHFLFRQMEAEFSLQDSSP